MVKIMLKPYEAQAKNTIIDEPVAPIFKLGGNSAMKMPHVENTRLKSQRSGS